MEKPKCKLIGENGNIFNLMGIASRALKANGMHKEADEMYERITGGEAQSYNEALCIIMEYVEVYWVERKYIGLEYRVFDSF